MDIPSALEELTSIDHRATALLRREHEAILGAFREYRDASRGTRETIGQQIAVLIEIHDRVERAVVYPALAPYYGPLIRAFLAEHEEISSCIAVIRDTRNSAADALAPNSSLSSLNLFSASRVPKTTSSAKSCAPACRPAEAWFIDAKPDCLSPS